MTLITTTFLSLIPKILFPYPCWILTIICLWHVAVCSTTSLIHSALKLQTTRYEKIFFLIFFFMQGLKNQCQMQKELKKMRNIVQVLRETNPWPHNPQQWVCVMLWCPYHYVALQVNYVSWEIVTDCFSKLLLDAPYLPYPTWNW